MTRDEIIRMAREAGIQFSLHSQAVEDNFIKHMGRFAALVAEHEREHGIKLLLDVLIDAAVKAEREACAKLAEEELNNLGVLTSWPGQSSAAFNILRAIRARGQE